MRKQNTELQICLKTSHFRFSFFFFFLLLGDLIQCKKERSLEAGLTAKAYDAVVSMAIMVALKFRRHLCEVSLEGTHMILQHIQNGSDWTDDAFFEPNNQGLCSTKNG